jgi:hypothetical protein
LLIGGCVYRNHAHKLNVEREVSFDVYKLRMEGMFHLSSGYCVSPDLFEDLNEFKIEEDSKELVCKECFEELEGSDE